MISVIKTPQIHQIRVNDNTIKFKYDFELYESGSRAFKTGERAFVEIFPDQPTHYTKYHSDIIYHLRNFLTLATGAAVLPLMVFGYSHLTEESGELNHRFHDVEIFYVAHGSGLPQNKKVNIPIPLFTYPDIVDNFQNYLQTWFSKAEKFKSMFELYFSLMYIPSIYIHLELLTLSQILETYHRLGYDGHYMNQTEYEVVFEKLRQAIPKELKEGHRESLGKRIEYGNEYSLRKRLQIILNEICAPYKEVMAILIPEPAKFIATVVDTRNYLTHYTINEKSQALLDANAQNKLSETMKILVNLCFFVELRMPVEIVKRITNSPYAATFTPSLPPVQEG